jgi:8-amino-7-oxononanoate synthase
MEKAGFENPFFRVNQKVENAIATIDGRQVVSYASFDYLGMASDPRVVQAAKDAIDQFGTSASASRLVGGDNSLLQDLDGEIAQFVGTEDALVLPSGYGTNASLIGHLFGPDDLVLYDELAHNSIVQGIVLSGAQRRAFPHNDAQFVDGLLSDLRSQHRRVVIAIEGLYSMDGDYPDLPKFLEVKHRHKALLYVDEAHSLGVLGAKGRGICEHYGVDADEGDIWMGTISKALGSGGGFVAGRKGLIQYLKYTAPALVFATAPSPANAAAALMALRLLQDQPQRVAQLHNRSRLFLQLCQQRGLNTGTSNGTPIIPIILGDSLRCIEVSAALLRQGVNARPILYPAVPENASRIRFFINAVHTEEQIRGTVELLVRCLAASQRSAG